jgi:hypothetical protein
MSLKIDVTERAKKFIYTSPILRRPGGWRPSMIHLPRLLIIRSTQHTSVVEWRSSGLHAGLVCLVGPNWGGRITVDYCSILFLFGKNCPNID